MKITPELIANHFVKVICEKKPRTKHVRRVASWIGFLVHGLDKIGAKFEIKNRQLRMLAGGRKYKVRFQHKLPVGGGIRGGIEIIEMPSGIPVRQFRNLSECAAFYDNPALTPKLTKAI